VADSRRAALGFAEKKQVGMRPKETTMWYSAVGGFVTLTLSLLAAPSAVNAQPSAKVARIGYLSIPGSPGSTLVEAFRQGLRELGYVEGYNIAIEFRAAQGSDRLPAVAAELVQLPVDVIVAFSIGAAQAVKNTTTTIPIVTVSSGDPVATGLVVSLARPSGNITGLTGMAT
jgi:putative ABC transport system substrate-binding protein